MYEVNDSPEAISPAPTVLLVDDHQDSLSARAAFIKVNGFQVLTENSAESALMAVQRHRVDLVVSDVVMPGMSGVEFCRRLKLAPATRETPVLLITALRYDDAGVREGLLAGADDYLPSYAPPELLRIKIDRLIAQSADREARRHAERVLRESESRYKDLVEHSQDLMCTHDLEGRILSVNEGAARRLGYEPAEILRMRIGDILAPEFRGEFNEYQSRVTRDGVARGRMVVMTRNGRRMVWEYNNTLRTEGVSSPVVRGMAHDITSLVQAQNDLEAKSRLLQAVIEGVPAAVFVKDSAGHYLLINSAGAQMVGKTTDEVMGKTDAELFSSESSGAIAERDLRIMQSGAPMTFEETSRAGGVTRTYMATKAPFRDPHGDIAGVLGIAVDVTAAKRVEQELIESERRYRQLFNSNPEPMWVYDFDTLAILAVNDAAIHFYGYSREEFLSLTLQDLRPAEDVPEMLRHFSKPTEPTFGPRVFRHKKKDGTVVYMEILSQELGLNERRTRLVLAKDTTERRQIEQARTHLAAIVESSNDAIIGKALDGTITSWNKGAERVYGYKAEEVIGRPIFMLTPAERVEEMQEILERVRRGELVDQLETVRLAKGGRRVDVSLMVSPIKDSSGNSVGASIIARDVTERKRAEAELYESERRWREMMENLQLIAIILDVQGNVLFCNEFLCHLTGWRREEIVGGSWFKQFIPEDRGEIKEMFLASLSEGHIPAHYENPILTRGGKLREIAWNNTMLRDANGNIIGTASIGEDITEHKRAEEALRLSEAKLSGILSMAADAIISTDEAQKVTLFNEGAEKIFGYSRSDTLGRPLEMLLPERFRRSHADFMRDFGLSAVTQGPGELHDILWQRKDGEEFHAEASVSKLQIGGDKIFTVILRDVTERKRLEQQLLQAQKMEAVGRLAGGVAHDFNNLLTAILGYAEMALARLQQEHPLHQHLKEIEKAGHRAAALTRQLLAFSRRQVVQPKVVSLNTVVGEMGNLLRRVIGEDIELTTLLAPGLGKVKADITQIEQVIVNLAVNARDAMPNGGRLIIETSNVVWGRQDADLYPEVAPGSYVLLTVSDTGVGMDREVVARIFEPFFTTKEQGKGTGLGLSTVYGIVKQSRGHISVYSESGGGTSFKIYLPVTDEMGEPAAARRQAATTGGSETILLVEDDELVRKLVYQILSKNGYKVLEAACPDEALDLMGQYDLPVHLMVSDIVMPKMSGRELAERLAAERGDLKVLYMSGYTRDTVIHHGVLDSEMAFLQKPFSPEALASKVRMVLDATAREPEKVL